MLNSLSFSYIQHQYNLNVQVTFRLTNDSPACKILLASSVTDIKGQLWEKSKIHLDNRLDKGKPWENTLVHLEWKLGKGKSLENIIVYLDDPSVILSYVTCNWSIEYFTNDFNQIQCRFVFMFFSSKTWDLNKNTLQFL